MLLDIIIGVIILINLLLGLKRGLLVMLGRLALLALVVAVILVLAGPLTDALVKAPFLAPISENIAQTVLEPLRDSAANIGMAIESFGIPKMLGDLLQSMLPTPDNSVAQAYPAFSEALFRFFLQALVFILLFIIVVIVISILTRALTRAADKVAVVGAGNRLGGLLLGTLIGLFQSAMLLLFLGFISPVWGAAADWINESWVAARFFEIDILALLF